VASIIYQGLNVSGDDGEVSEGEEFRQGAPSPGGFGLNVRTEPPHFRVIMISCPLVVERRGREGEQYTVLPAPMYRTSLLAVVRRPDVAADVKQNKEVDGFLC